MTIKSILRRLLGASFVHTHDYARDERPDRRGTGPFRHHHGRLSIYWDSSAIGVSSARNEVDVEWSIFNPGHKWIGWAVKTDCGERKLHLGFGLGALYFTHESWPHYRDLRELEWSWQFGLPSEAQFDRLGVFRWKFGESSMEWRSKTPRWKQGSWYPYESIAKALLGKETVETTTIETHAVVVPMPEGTYPATVRIEERTRRRARIPWPTSVSRSASIDMGTGIPVPGKGENSWDCGLDAIQGTGSREPSVAAAIASAVRSATDHRRRYGGPDWLPPAKSEPVPA